MPWSAHNPSDRAGRRLVGVWAPSESPRHQRPPQPPDWSRPPPERPPWRAHRELRAGRAKEIDADKAVTAAAVDYIRSQARSTTPWALAAGFVAPHNAFVVHGSSSTATIQQWSICHRCRRAVSHASTRRCASSAARAASASRWRRRKCVARAPPTTRWPANGCAGSWPHTCSATSTALRLRAVEPSPPRRVVWKCGRLRFSRSHAARQMPAAIRRRGGASRLQIALKHSVMICFASP